MLIDEGVDDFAIGGKPLQSSVVNSYGNSPIGDVGLRIARRSLTVEPTKSGWDARAAGKASE
jgi:hypothetical protein